MAYFEMDIVGLIIAALNVATFLLLVYLFLEWVADERSALLRALDRVFAPLLDPLRRRIPKWRIDAGALIAAAVLQLIAFAIKTRYR